MEPTQLNIVSSKSDKELAAEYRTALEEKIKPVLALLDAAARDGLTIHFGVGPDAFNRQCITQLVVTRVL